MIYEVYTIFYVYLSFLLHFLSPPLPSYIIFHSYKKQSVHL